GQSSVEAPSVRQSVPAYPAGTRRNLMTTRRDFLTLTAGAVAGASLGTGRAAAAPKAMTVVRESSFIKPFDDYFAKTLATEYEKLTGIKITYEAGSVGRGGPPGPDHRPDQAGCPSPPPRGQ